MTDEQRAELRELNARIEATDAENRPILLGLRAHLLAQTDCELRTIAGDCDAYFRHRYHGHDWECQPAWKKRAELLGSAPNLWKQTRDRRPQNEARAKRFNSDARYRKAFATAAFAYIVELSPELQAYRAQHDFDALAALENAEASDEPNQNAGLEAWQIAALARHFTRGAEAAARVYQRVLERQIAAGFYSAATSSHVRRARCLQSEPYRQLAWWNLVVASAPDEAKWWNKRARCLDRQCRDFRAARRDYERALAPDDPRAHEALAKLTINEDWWNLAPDARSDAANYVRAFGLRIASGQIAGTPAQLQAQGDQQMRQISNISSVSPDYRYARAYAFYRLALTADPTDAALHLKCAQTLQASPMSYLMHVGKGLPRAAPLTYKFYACALQLNNDLAAARAGVIAYLTRNLQPTTHHERLELLLDERRNLRELGMEEALTDAIIAQVERALAA